MADCVCLFFFLVLDKKNEWPKTNVDIMSCPASSIWKKDLGSITLSLAALSTTQKVGGTSGRTTTKDRSLCFVPNALNPIM